MPPCMTTSVWPSDAIASADANGSIVSSTPLLRLDDANTQLAASSTTGSDEDRRESTGQQACRPSRNRVLRLGRTAPVRFRAHVVGDSNAYNSRSQGMIKFQFLLREQARTIERSTALDTAETLCMMRFLILQERERTLSTLTYDCVSLLNNQRCERRKRRPEPTGDGEERAG